MGTRFQKHVTDHLSKNACHFDAFKSPPNKASMKYVCDLNKSSYY